MTEKQGRRCKRCGLGIAFLRGTPILGCPVHGPDKVYVLGVDPGKVSGAGLVSVDPFKWRRTRLLKSWQHTKRRVSEELFAAETIREAAGLAREDHAAEANFQAGGPLICCCIEGQFHRSSGGGAKFAAGVIMTAQSHGIWRGLAAAEGFKIFDTEAQGRGAQPHEWRGMVQGMVGRPGADLDVWARDAVKVMHGLETLKTHHHRAEAVLIADFAAQQISIRLQAAKLEWGAL